MSDAGDVATKGTPSNLAYTVKLLLGILFLLVPGRQWQSRREEGEGAEIAQKVTVVTD